METTFFFVRHAEPNYDNHNDLTRELTEKGLQDSQLLIPFFKNITINKVLSSPYKRSIDTVLPLAKNRQLDIQCIDNLRERKIDDVWIEDFNAFAKQQWEDKTFKLANGESLQEVQKRQVATINSLLTTNMGDTLIIGSHGTALSSLINYYHPEFTYKDFEELKHLFPFVAKFVFNNQICQSITIYNIFTGDIHDIHSI